MVKLAGTFSHFKPFKALVLGDFMLDTYTTGKVTRISPEAPVSILHVQHEESRAGGAGNVALNLRSLGADVFVLGRVGRDSSGEKLIRTLQENKIHTEGLIVQDDFSTPVKNRLIADSQQIIRVDHEIIANLSKDWEKQILEQIEDYLTDTSVVAISDYNKGFLTKTFLRAFLKKAREKDIPVICDPKGHDFAKYSGAYIIKPNLKEAYGAAAISPDEPLEKVADFIFKNADIEYFFVTRSEEGISLFSKNLERKDFPVRSREVIDVTGAGDTVLAMISAAIANDLDIDAAAQLANIAAGIAIEKVGCARITLSDLARRLLELDYDNKIFDESHLYALQQVLQGKHYSVLVVDSKNGLTTKTFRTIHRLSKRNEHELIIYVRDTDPDEDFIHLLSSLNEVDYIILRKESIKNLCEAIHPVEVFFMEEEKPKEAKALLASLAR